MTNVIRSRYYLVKTLLFFRQFRFPVAFRRSELVLHPFSPQCIHTLFHALLGILSHVLHCQFVEGSLSVQFGLIFLLQVVDLKFS